MEESAYARLHSAWVSSNTGSTMYDPLLANLPLPLIILFTSALCYNQRHHTFVREFILIITPTVLNLTTLSYNTHILPILILILSVFYCFFVRKKGSFLSVFNRPTEKRLAWVTNFRASVNIITVICILAVDLNIFPPKFAKTEVYGYGLMDLGVGMYVICHGLVYKEGKFKDELKSSTAMITLGFIRLVSIKLIGYHENITEYGVHWNFFFTLACCRILSNVICTFFNTTNYFLLAISLGILHNFVLSSGGQDWVLGSSERETIWGANREGLVSICGYLTLFYASAAFKKFISKRNVGSGLIYCIGISTILWSLTCLTSEFFNVSRRLCNIGYIFWTSWIACSMICIFMSMDILINWFGYPRVPSLFFVVNRRGLAFFLLGNILTGFVNISVQTLLLSTWQSYFLLFAYILVTTILTKQLHNILGT